VVADELSVAQAIQAGLVAGGAGLVTYLPDSRFATLEGLLEQDRRLRVVRCAREDEGVAVAVGAAMGGLLPVAVMEGTGLGLCGLILARARVQHTPLLLLVSHTDGPGESRPFHSTAIAAGAAVLNGFGIPARPLDDAGRITDIVAQTLVTVATQRTIHALTLPGLVHAGSVGTADAGTVAHAAR
jgi:sulfopyruvate decarboxylase subunit alpha